MKKIAALVDGNNMSYRTHFGHIALRSKSGRPSGLFFGFLNEMLRINKLLPESPMIFCWDGPGKTWRHQLVPSYKANRRHTMPGYDEFIAQVPELRAMVSGLEFHSISVSGLEADDVIGVLCHALKDSMDVRIVSTDRDFYQLVDESVRVWSRDRSNGKAKDVLVGAREVEQWLGAPVGAFVDIRAMAGDSSDNLKGIRGVGLKTAANMWKQGFRLGATNGTWAKYSVDSARLALERKLVKIVTKADDPRLGECQREELAACVDRVVQNPYRKERYSKEIRAALYAVCGRYDLDEIFKNRDRFWMMP